MGELQQVQGGMAPVGTEVVLESCVICLHMIPGCLSVEKKRVPEGICQKPHWEALSPRQNGVLCGFDDENNNLAFIFAATKHED